MTEYSVTIKKVIYRIIYPATEVPEFGSSFLGLDIETAPKIDHLKAGLDPYMTKISLVQIYDLSCKTVYIYDVLESGIEFLLKIFPKYDWIAHNSKFELTHLSEAGANFPDSIHCTMLMSQLIGAIHTPQDDPDEDELDTPVGERDGIGAYKRFSNSLENCCIRWLSVAPDKHLQTSTWGTRPLSFDQIRYAGLDAILTYDLFQLFLKILKKYNMLQIYKLQKLALLPIVDMEVNGISFDWTAHARLIKKWKEDFVVADDQAKDIFKKINLASPKQMGEWLKSAYSPEIVAMWPRTAKKNLSFTETNLADFRHYPEIECLFKWKKLNKLLTTYGEEFARKHRHFVTHRLHTSFTLGETATGRMSSRSPNLQNQPPIMHSLFIASEGKLLVVADFSQVELRIQAERSQDPVMLDAFRTGKDIYKVMAASLFNVPYEEVTNEQRKLGKVAMLSLGYGTRSKKLRASARSKHDLEITEAQSYEVYNAYHTTFYVYSQWCDRIRETIETSGLANTLTGKLRKIAPDKIFTQGPNHDIQGTAIELQLLASNKAREAGVKLVLSVHDELVAECLLEEREEVEGKLSKAMNDSMLEMFPNCVSHEVAEAYSGSNWAIAKKKPLTTKQFTS